MNRTFKTINIMMNILNRHSHKVNPRKCIKRSVLRPSDAADR